MPKYSSFVLTRADAFALLEVYLLFMREGRGAFHAARPDVAHQLDPRFAVLELRDALGLAVFRRSLDHFPMGPANRRVRLLAECPALEGFALALP